MMTPQKLFILDTNIIQYTNNRYSELVFTSLLNELDQEGYSGHISSITIYELLKGANKKIEKEMLLQLNSFKKFEVLDNILQTAAQLETLYRLDGIQPNQIEQGDKIIAATALVTNSHILTANGRDFPYPFFIEEKRKLLEFEVQKKRYKVIPVSFIYPDLEIINKKILEIPD